MSAALVLLLLAVPPQAVEAARPPAEAKPVAARTMRLVVLDPDGKPLSGAKVLASVWTEEDGFKANRDYVTDKEGAVRVALPRTLSILRLWASKKPFARLFASWERSELQSGGSVPDEFTFRMERCTTVGGRIVDEQGEPVAGAKVEVYLADGTFPVDDKGRVRFDSWFANGDAAATTDTAGRWRIDTAPNRPEAELELKVFHPDYVSDEYQGQLQKASGITTAMLHDETATLTLERGVVMRGQVTDASGSPMKDAFVLPDEGVSAQFARTDAEGRFQLPAMPPQTTSLTVLAPGFAPAYRRIDLRPETAEQNFQMEPGKPVRLRIVDAAGKPVAGARVFPDQWLGRMVLDNIWHSPRLDLDLPKRTDEHGGWEWTWAPDEPVTYHVGAKSFAPVDVDAAGGEPVKTVTLKPEHRVTGQVVDAVTGEPIESFTVIPIDVFRKNWLHAERYNGKPGKDGRLDYLATRTDIPIRLRVEATGYRTQTGPEFRVGDDDARRQDFRLEPSPPVTGTVVDAKGEPVAQAKVIMATRTQEIDLADGDNNHTATTDADGRFAFPAPGEPYTLLARTPDGFARGEDGLTSLNAGTLQLQSWAAVRGRFVEDGQPVRGARVYVRPVRIDSLGRPQVESRLRAVTGPDGRFEFPQLPPGPVSVSVFLGPWKDEGFRSGPSVPLDLQPGESRELELGNAGATVTGTVKLAGEVPDDLDCTYSLNYLVRREPGIALPSEIEALGFDVSEGWQDAWGKTNEGRAYLGTLPHWFVKLAADGRFLVSGVPAGEYLLAFEIYTKPSGCLIDPVARQVVPVTVTEDDVARGTLTLPEIVATVEPLPTVGDAPALAFHSAEGADGTLADCRGRYTVVHFWASWCVPCKGQLPSVRRLHERFADRGVTLLSLSLDEDADAWHAALERSAPPGRQGRLDTEADDPVSGVPEYWLLDPDGKIVARSFTPDDLADSLAERLK